MENFLSSDKRNSDVHLNMHAKMNLWNGAVGIGNHFANSKKTSMRPKKLVPNHDNSESTQKNRNVGHKIFGISLEQVLFNEYKLGIGKRAGGVNMIPRIVDICLKFLQSGHQLEQGLFRLSGDSNEIQTLKSRIDSGEFSCFTKNTSCHSISGLLKLYIRELPSPLYPKRLQSLFLDTMNLEDNEERRLRVIQLLKELPFSHYILLKRLTGFLFQLSKHFKENKMNSTNLATIWGPNLMWNEDYELSPRGYLNYTQLVCKYIKFTIDEFEEIFLSQIPDERTPTTGNHANSTQSSDESFSPSDIRQMTQIYEQKIFSSSMDNGHVKMPPSRSTQTVKDQLTLCGNLDGKYTKHRPLKVIKLLTLLNPAKLRKFSNEMMLKLNFKEMNRKKFTKNTIN